MAQENVVLVTFKEESTAYQAVTVLKEAKRRWAHRSACGGRRAKDGRRHAEGQGR